MKTPTISYAAWEDGEYVVTMDGAPIGRTVSRKEATFLVEWLKTAVLEVLTNADMP
jgi:hypothetical protein